MAFSYGTPLHTAANSFKNMQDFQVGDLVWVAETPDLTSWVQKPVQFSSGTGPGTGNAVIHIEFAVRGDWGSDDYLVTTPDQPFFMPDKTLKQAKEFREGDVLVLGDGTTRSVSAVLLESNNNRGLHHIAMSHAVPDRLDGHLLLARGVVVGDYATLLAVRHGKFRGGA